MSRHLTEYFIEQTLKRGKGVAQFLGSFDHNGQKAVRYLLIYPKEQDFQLWVQESYDEGSEDLCDIGEFTSIHDDDEPIQYTFPNLEQTLEFATKSYGASLERWVNESVIGDEYSDFIKSKQS
jgi:hypothetical protein